MNDKESREMALQLLKTSKNWILIAENVSVSINTETGQEGQVGMCVASHLWGVSEQEMHSFLIATRKAEDTLLEALRNANGVSITSREIVDMGGKK